MTQFGPQQRDPLVMDRLADVPKVASRGEPGDLPLQRRRHSATNSGAVAADVEAIDTGPIAVVTVGDPSPAVAAIDVARTQRAGHVGRRNKAMPDRQTIGLELERRGSCNRNTISVGGRD